MSLTFVPLFLFIYGVWGGVAGLQLRCPVNSLACTRFIPGNPDLLIGFEWNMQMYVY